jgi:S1-C subfamily serine protease
MAIIEAASMLRGMLPRAAIAVFLVLGAFPAAALAQPAAGKPAPAPPSPSPPEIRRFETAFAGAADRVAPSLVQLDVTVREDVESRFTRFIGKQGDTPMAHATGSGLIMGADGTIVTNSHLIEDALAISVRLQDGRLLPARLVGRDPPTDLAVLKVEATGLPLAKFVETDPRAGQWVVAVGAPFGAGTTVSAGIVSAKGRGGLGVNSLDDYLQVDAAISATNTGGPICDLEGRVLGISTLTLGRPGGVNLAIPSALAKRIVEQILKSGRVERAWLGASLQDLSPDLAAMLKVDPPAGVIISAVAENGPAKKANLKAGDVIAAVNNNRVRDPAELLREVYSRASGQAVTLEVLRDGKRYATQVTLSARPEPPLPPVPAQQQGVPQVGLGFNVRDLTAQEASARGLPPKAMPVITVVAPGSSADRAGMKVGDVIVEADGVIEGNTQALQQASQDGQVLLRLRRREVAFYAALKK